MASRAYEPGEIAARGESIYQEQFLPQVGPVEKGTFVVIDVESGDYEVDPRDATATRRLLKRRPEAVTYGVRVGYRAAYRHVGAHLNQLPPRFMHRADVPTHPSNQGTPRFRLPRLCSDTG